MINIQNPLKKSLISLVITFGATVAANAATVALYEFENTFTSTINLPNTIVSSVSVGSGVNPNPPVFSGTSFSGARSMAMQGLTESTFGDAVTAGEYFEFSIYTDDGSDLSFSELSLALQRSNDPGSASTVVLTSSLDNFASAIDTISPTTTFLDYSIDLSDVQFQNVSTSVSNQLTFRLYTFGGTNATSSLRVDDVTLNTSTIPEPSTFWLVGATGIALVVGLRQRRKKAA